MKTIDDIIEKTITDINEISVNQKMKLQTDEKPFVDYDIRLTGNPRLNLKVIPKK